MRIIFHPVDIKLTESFRARAEKKVGRSLHVFHKVTSVNLFVRAEKALVLLEVLVAADDERFYVSQEDSDLLRALDKLCDRLSETARKHKTRQRKHTSRKAEHHGHLVLHRNIASHNDFVGEDQDVYSAKPLSRFEAYLELRISPYDILIYRDVDSGRVHLMLKEHGAFFLIAPKVRRFFIGRRPKADRFEQAEFSYSGERFLVRKKQVLVVRAMDSREAMADLKKQDFCFFIDSVRGGYSILFHYGRGRTGLVENIGV